MSSLDTTPGSRHSRQITEDLDPDTVVQARRVIASRALDADDAQTIMAVLGIGYDRIDADGYPLPR